MKKGNKAKHTAIAAILSCAAITAHAQEGQPLKIRLNADIRSTDPGMNRDANTDAVVLHVVEGLVAYRGNLTVAPMLAQSVDVSDDGTQYTFKLRQNVRFHNGKELTSQDVLFAWNRYMKPENHWRCLSEFDGSGTMKVVNAVAVDPSTIRFTLEKPSALFLATMARTDCGSTGIYHADSVGADGTWVKPIGTGPFEWNNWVRGQYIDLKKFDAYSSLPGKSDGLAGNKTALVPDVRFSIIPDPSAAKAALLSGNLDIIFDIANADMAELENNEKVRLQSVPNMELNAVLFQTKNSAVKDVRIRQAILLSLDIPQLVQAVAGNEAEPSLSVIPYPSGFYGKAQSTAPTRDLKKAKELLAAAGYTGQPIKLVTTKQYQSLFDTAVLLQAMAAEAGINIQLEVVDWATELDSYKSGNYQMMSFSYSARLDPSLSFGMISGDKSKQPQKVWDNEEARALIVESSLMADPAQRQQVFDKLEQLYRTDLPMIGTYSPVSTSAVRKGIAGYSGWSLGQPRAWGITVEK